MLLSMMRMIAAIDSQRGIADDKGIPWDLPTDKQFFVDQTREGLILMGYNTYLEFTKPMHGRTNYVVTHRVEQLHPGFEPIHDVQAFITKHSADVIQNIGGAGLFTSTLDRADELILTRLEADFHCTKFFPPYEAMFVCVDRSEPFEENGTSYTFETWHRK